MHHGLQALVQGDRLLEALSRLAADIGKRGLPERPEPGRRVLDLLALRRPGRDQKPGRHPRDRRVQARFDRGDPENGADDCIDGAAPDPEAAEDDDDHETGDPDRDRDEIDRVGVDGADHGDRGDVVGDRQRQQEDAQLGRAIRADERERAEQERRVGPDHHAPAVRRLAGGVEREIQQRGQHHAADCGDPGNDEPAALGELAHRQLTADLQSDHEEEGRHQPVVDPVGEIEAELVAADPDRQVGAPERLVGVRERGVRPDERDRRRRQQQTGAARLGAEEAAERRRQGREQLPPAGDALIGDMRGAGLHALDPRGGPRREGGSARAAAARS